MFARDCNPEYLFLNCYVAIEDESERKDINITKNYEMYQLIYYLWGNTL